MGNWGNVGYCSQGKNVKCQGMVIYRKDKGTNVTTSWSLVIMASVLQWNRRMEATYSKTVNSPEMRSLRSGNKKEKFSGLILM